MKESRGAKSESFGTGDPCGEREEEEEEDLLMLWVRGMLRVEERD